MPKINIDCSNCGETMTKWKSQIPKAGKAFCSLSCSTSYRNTHEFNPSHTRDLTGENNPMWGRGDLVAGEKNGMYGRNGELNPNWQGGRHDRGDGYYRVSTGESKRVLEHRKVLEDAGYNLEGMIVHHRDGNPSNNDINNLQVMTQSEHAKLHVDLRKQQK